jgi:hypothetical protein
MPPRYAAGVASLLVLVFLMTSTTPGATPRLDAATIKAALRTAQPEEDGFVDRVVALVNQRKLPYKLVYSTFLWARAKPRHKFQYFKRALILRAARIGVRL